MEERIVVTENAELFCRSYGKGVPLLMIHGAVVDSDFFDGTAKLLAEKYRVITYDRRGYSRSNGKISGDFLDISARDAIAVLDCFAPDEKALIVSHSAGALIAMRLATLFPERVSLLIAHEPPIVAILPEDHPIFEKVERITAFIEKEKFGRASTNFVMLVSEDTENSKPKPEETSLREEKNIRFFIKNEFTTAFDRIFPAEIPKKVKTIVCAGKDHPESFLHTAGKTFAEMHGYDFIEIPGKHNLAYNVPKTFAKELINIIGNE
ncbi:MAG: alpha/beta hydrolase [Oscillospiraceae bacterium]|nr:alpha/beta hydrolase [Oscillospiraceae bacterium]